MQGVERGMVIGAERDSIDERRSPEYIPEQALIAAQPLRSNTPKKYIHDNKR